MTSSKPKKDRLCDHHYLRKKWPELSLATSGIALFVLLTFIMCLHLNIQGEQMLQSGGGPATENIVKPDIYEVFSETESAKPMKTSSELRYPKRSRGARSVVDIQLDLLQHLYVSGDVNNSLAHFEEAVMLILNKRKSIQYLLKLYEGVTMETKRANRLEDKSSASWAIGAYGPAERDGNSLTFHLTENGKCNVTRVEFIVEVNCQGHRVRRRRAVTVTVNGNSLRETAGTVLISNTAVFDLTSAMKDVSSSYNSVTTSGAVGNESSDTRNSTKGAVDLNVTLHPGGCKPAHECESMLFVYCSINDTIRTRLNQGETDGQVKQYRNNLNAYDESKSRVGAYGEHNHNDNEDGDFGSGDNFDGYGESRNDGTGNFLSRDANKKRDFNEDESKYWLDIFINSDDGSEWPDSDVEGGASSSAMLSLFRSKPGVNKSERLYMNRSKPDVAKSARLSTFRFKSDVAKSAEESDRPQLVAERNIAVHVRNHETSSPTSPIPYHSLTPNHSPTPSNLSKMDAAEAAHSFRSKRAVATLQGCYRKPLRVALRNDLNLPVLFPRHAVDIGQCSGTCEHAFFMGQVRPGLTAHAVALNRLRQTRKAACVPHHLETISVLMVPADGSSVVEIVNWSNMVVASCRCA